MSDLLSVTVPATASSLTTLDAVKAELGLSGSSDDTKITGLIARVSAVIARACRGRVFGRETVAETWRQRQQWLSWSPRGVYHPRAPLILSRVPVVTVTSITEDGTALVVTDDYEIDARAGLLWRVSSGCRTDWRCAPVVVTYAAGWLLPGEVGRNLPADVEDVCIELVRRSYYGAARDGAVQSDQVEGAGRVVYFAGTTSGSSSPDSALLDRLAPYCRVLA